MYRRDGKGLQEREEGAAIFRDVIHVPSNWSTQGLGMIPPRTMGLQPGMLRRGFVPANGLGQAAATAETYAPWTPWLLGAIGVIGGFCLVRR
jgi:hypothetical protein